MKHVLKNGRTVYGWFATFVLVGLLLPTLSTGAVRIKDLAVVEGVRDNQLVGYGIVVGLNGTGDGSQAVFTSQGLANMLDRLGMQVDPQSLKVKNVAGVMVTAKLPPFMKPGQRIDVLLSSLGDAKSLQGGTLVATPLKGLDGEVYAIAQGPLVIGGTAPNPHLTAARVPDGATVERGVPVALQDRERLTLSLKTADFTTVRRMVAVIDQALGGGFAKARDGATVDISLPEAFRDRVVALVAELENLEVEPDLSAKVILDERTGTVVMGGDVKIGRIALSHGNLNLRVGGTQPSAPGSLLNIEDGTSLGEVVKALNAIGVAPRDMIAIFQSIKASGALRAELEII
ncbi:MAG: flagellar basal body P-ring protein FlgI [Proteobacteria bacterium]|nr:flagellar basal body P-ring protein FlgI [Pseudomonadota bacterium]MBU1687473.1 flagellar basal body P-ring protein FlgI [Pseudomonadota bacterium]